jgi:hypothetical protein
LFSYGPSKAGQKYAVQIAASTTPQNIPDLAEKFAVADSIFVVQSGQWHRYMVGVFDNPEDASNYAHKLLENTKLQNAFVQVFDFGPVERSIPDAVAGSIIVPDKVTGTSMDPVASKQENETLGVEIKATPGQEKQNPNGQRKGNFLLKYFFTKNEISALKNSLIDYGNNYLPRETRKVFTTLVERTFQFPVILLFVVFILFFMVNIILLFFLLNHTINRKRYKDRFVAIYGNMYEKVLLSYIFGEISWETASIKLKRKEGKSNRDILISILLTFHENFKGDMEKFVPDIFLKLGLQKDSLARAKSYFNYRKVQGIRELTYLYPDGARELIVDLINDPNDLVRAEAQTAFIRLNPDRPFDFFLSLKKPFTRWTQLSAFNLLRVKQLPVPSFADFLDSGHTNIRNFSLRMINYFQQLENSAKIFKILESPVEQTRFLSYKAINDLRLYEGKDEIKKRYFNETNCNKIEIIKALRNIGGPEDFEFLESIIGDKGSVSLRIEACKSMYFMGSEARERLMNMETGSVEGLQLLIAHVTDIRN